MELSETSKIEMHGSALMNLFYKDQNRFYTLRELQNRVMEAPWADFNLIYPAIQRLTDRRQLEHDPTYGYCLHGKKNALRQDIANAGPKMSRQEFDKLAPAEQGAFMQNGGRLT